MKTRTYVSIMIFILAVMIASDGFAKRKKPISDEDLVKAYTGSWINTEVGYYKPKVIMYAGRWEHYTAIENETPYCYGDINLMEKWRESNGDVFFEYRWECEYHKEAVGYELLRISDSGKTLERIYTTGERRVEEWDPTNILYTYKIYYRQE